MRLAILLAVVASTALTTQVQAGWPEFWHQSQVDRARNNIWPQPFRSMDARAVTAPFELMKNKGWQRYNTLGSPLFSADQRLTNAGEQQINWIVRRAPQNRRVIFVLRGDSPEQTAQRVEEVQLAVSEILPTGDLPPIYVTDVEPYLSSGRLQTSINRALQQSIPAPVLPPFTSLNAPANQQQISTQGNN